MGEFISVNYESAVSDRNRAAVDILNESQELMAEIVGLSSAIFAKSLISSLPKMLEPGRCTLHSDLARLPTLLDYMNLDLVASNGGEAIGCHGAFLALRCP